jgi:transposase-like protein
MRKSPKVENLLPILYLKGLSTSDFHSALSDFLGEGVSGLSPSSIVALKKSWEKDFAIWKKRKITDRYVYLFADGVHVSVRLGEDKKLCLLVLIGVAENGEKHLLAVDPGYRESKDSWRAVLSDLRDRGLAAPVLAVGDGALGFWAALRETAGFESTREQRCWLHKMGNILNDLPKRVQPRAKGMLREIMYAETLSAASLAKQKFLGEVHQKYPKAAARLEKDWSELTAFFSLPALHWTHLRTTNAIESTFATVRLRTNVTRGAGSPVAASTMAFKLLQDAEKTWNRIRGYDEISNVLDGVAYANGVMIPGSPSTRQEAPAA